MRRRLLKLWDIHTLEQIAIKKGEITLFVKIHVYKNGIVIKATIY